MLSKFLNNHIYIILLIFSVTSSLNSQQSELFRHQIVWKLSNGVIDDLQFENSIFNDQQNGVLGLYYETRPFMKAKIITSNLTDVRTVVANVDEKLKKEIIQSEFSVQVSIEEIRGNYFLQTTINPIRKTVDGTIEKLTSFSVQINYENKLSSGLRNPEATYNSVLSSGDIYKISVNKSGVHKLDKIFLETKLGIDVSKINPKKLKIYGNRGGRVPESNSKTRFDDIQELNIVVTGEEDGKFDNNDAIFFYAEGADLWNYNLTTNTFDFDKNIYDNFNYYFLKIDDQDGKRIIKKSSSVISPEAIFTHYDMRLRLEEDKYNLLGTFTGTEGTGKEWYGDVFNNSVREKKYTSSFDFSGLNNNEPLEVDMVFAARSRVTSNVILNIGSKTISKSGSSVNVLDAESIYASKIRIKEVFNIPDQNPEVKVSYPAVSSDSEGWLDFLQIIFNRELMLSNNQFPFTNRKTKDFSTASFVLKNYTNQVIWDITNPFSPEEIPIQNEKITFNTENIVREFIAFNLAVSAFEPLALGKIPNQNLHRIKDEDMIIVYHTKFKDEALRLAEHRQKKSGLKIITAETNEIYNEFSSGKVDPGAIRDMARLLLFRNPEFRYLLLFGDGSYDYKGIVKDIPAENFVPVYETDQSLDPIDGFPSDDFYGLLGDDEGISLKGGMDIYVGRLPAKTNEEARTLVDKIIHYDSSKECLGDWKLRAGYVADDEDSNTHLRDIDDIAQSDEKRHILINQQKVYADAYKQVSTPGENRYPDANKSINDNIFKGQLSLTYLGHGGPLGWAQERILTVPEIQSWTNINSLTIMVTATCSFGAYDDPSVVSPAEYAILSPKGGAIAMLTTTRAVYTNSNKQLTDAAHELMFKKVNNQPPTLGYILAEGKNKYIGDFFRINSRKFALLGDPSLQVAMPKFDVVTSKINGKDANTIIDTLNALEKVTIEGYIANESGELASGFNGTIYPTVFDKKSTLQTLSNDPGSPKFNFTVFKNIIFKGSATVTNGKWSFSFWVPKNINYAYGNGRVSYYASDGSELDAGGLFNNLIIGGSSQTLIVDDEGPKMDAFMNDESFVSGGVTNANPVLLLNLSDDFGINVTGNAIGQDITAVLDGDNQNVFILNDFYEAQKDNFTQGKVRFPLNNLSKGSHFMVAKAWDISGNSTERRIDFVVTDDKNNGLKNVYNYPNPFTSSTLFTFEHDLANTELDIIVDIYTISGKLVKSLTETKYSSGFRVNDIGWNGNDDFDSGLARGIYLYKVKIHSKELNITRESSFEKLIKL